MSGIIIGAQGFQRSGKTLIMYLLAEHMRKLGIPVYSNIIAEGFNFINSIDELPFNFEPKILFIDELYNGADSQDYKTLKDTSILVNTLGKQNVLFMFTTIDMSMIYNRIRNQTQYVFLVKSDQKNIYYKIVDCNSIAIKDFQLKKDEILFEKCHYDTNYVPIPFNWNMDKFKKKLINYYENNYPQLLKYTRLG